MGKGFRKAFKRMRNTDGGGVNYGPCFKKDCTQNGAAIHTCLTCEKLAEEAAGCAGDRTKPVVVFSIQCCYQHDADGLKRVRRHAITAHPSNLLAVVAAGLKGEKI